MDTLTMPPTGSPPTAPSPRPVGGMTPEEIADEVTYLRVSLNFRFPLIKAACAAGHQHGFCPPGAVHDTLTRLAAATSDAEAAAIGREVGPVVLTNALALTFRRDCVRLRELGYDTFKAEASLSLCLRQDPAKDAKKAAGTKKQTRTTV